MNNSRTRRTFWTPKNVGIFIGVFFLLFILIVALFLPEPKEFQIFVFRVVLSIAAAGVGMSVTGFFEIRFEWLKNFVKGTGAICFFIAVYFVTPNLFEEPIKEINSANAFAIGYYNHYLLPLSKDSYHHPEITYDSLTQKITRSIQSSDFQIVVLYPQTFSEFSPENITRIMEQKKIKFASILSKQEERPFSVCVNKLYSHLSLDTIKLYDFPRTLIALKEISMAKMDMDIDKIDFKGEKWKRIEQNEIHEFVESLKNLIYQNEITKERVTFIELRNF